LSFISASIQAVCRKTLRAGKAFKAASFVHADEKIERFCGTRDNSEKTRAGSRLLFLAEFLEARILPERIEPEQRGVNPSQHQKEKQSGGCFCRCRLSIMLR
jgi:hypothetical protein